jgi:hypothetical protein
VPILSMAIKDTENSQLAIPNNEEVILVLCMRDREVLLNHLGPASFLALELYVMLIKETFMVLWV